VPAVSVESSVVVPVATPECRLLHPRPARVLDLAKFEMFGVPVGIGHELAGRKGVEARV
jgi:hypothetical protein